MNDRLIRIQRWVFYDEVINPKDVWVTKRIFMFDH